MDVFLEEVNKIVDLATVQFHIAIKKRKNIKYLSIIQMLIRMLLGSAIQIKRERFMLLEGLTFGGIWGLTTPFWVKIVVI